MQVPEDDRRRLFEPIYCNLCLYYIVAAPLRCYHGKRFSLQ